MRRHDHVQSGSDHVISADELETFELWIKTMDWAGELIDLFRNGNTETIHKDSE
jgi:hypothetical protein